MSSIYFYEIKQNWWNKIAETTFAKVVIGIDIDDIENLEDLLRILFIDEGYGNVKVVVENLLETLTKRRSQTFYEVRSLICGKCYRGGHFFNKQVEHSESGR